MLPNVRKKIYVWGILTQRTWILFEWRWYVTATLLVPMPHWSPPMVPKQKRIRMRVAVLFFKRERSIEKMHTATEGREPSRYPFIVAKWPSCQMWKASLNTFVLLRISSCVFKLHMQIVRVRERIIWEILTFLYWLSHLPSVHGRTDIDPERHYGSPNIYT